MGVVNYNRPNMASKKKHTVKQANNTFSAVFRYNFSGEILILIIAVTTSINLMVVNASSDNESSNVDG